MNTASKVHDTSRMYINTHTLRSTLRSPETKGRDGAERSEHTFQTLEVLEGHLQSSVNSK